MSDYVYMGYVKNQNREENGELFSRYKVSVLKDEKVLEIYCTTM